MADMRSCYPHQTLVCNMSKVTRTELAKFLDGSTFANWELLAERLGVAPMDTKWLKDRACNTRHGSFTLLFFEEYCYLKKISVAELILALGSMNHRACLSVLEKAYGEEFVRSVLLAPDSRLNATLPRFPQDTYLQLTNDYHEQHQHPPAMTTRRKEDIWSQVRNIGNNFEESEYHHGGYREPAYEDSDDIFTSRKEEKGVCGGCEKSVEGLNDSRKAPVSCVPPSPKCEIDRPQQQISRVWEGDNDEKHERTEKMTKPPENPPSVRYSSLPRVQNGDADDAHKEVKRHTHPISDKDVQKLEELNITGKIHQSSTLPDVQHSVFAVDKRHIRVFITYTDDSKEHRGQVLRLCECLKKNHFSVSIDVRETHLLKEGTEVVQWHDSRYNVADYVLVLVSPVYRRVVEMNAQPSDLNAARNAVHIYHRMKNELSEITRKGLRRRFIALVMPGSTKADVPDWLQASCPVYSWPGDYLNVFYCMVSPAKVVSNYIQKREQDILPSACENTEQKRKKNSSKA